MDIPYDSLAVVLHICAAVGMSIRLISRKLNITVTLSWILLIVFLPIAGLTLYWLFGSQKLGRRRQKLGKRIREHYMDTYNLTEDSVDPADLDTDPHFNDLARAVEGMTGFAPMEGNKVKLLDTDKKIFAAMVEDIEAANETVFAEFYIIDPAGMPLDVLNALIKASERGCDVKLLADAIGSRPFFKSEWPDKLEAAGVDVVTSLPVGLIKSISKRTDLRNHRKLLILDQRVGYIGSCNLTDPKLFKPDDGDWVDLMARIEGPFAESLSVILAADFIYDQTVGDFTRSDLDTFPSRTIHTKQKGPAVLQLAPSGPEMSQSVIYETIVSAIFSAQDRIRIVTPYFVPDEALLLALTNAARRGLDVELVLPADGDSIMVRYASAATFDALLSAGVKIGRFHGGMLHTKALIIDEDISLIGTVNMDLRSFHLNLEVTMIAYDETVNSDLNAIFENYLKETDWIDQEKWSERGRIDRAKENVFRLVSPLL
jgi:cardiolipin synthase